MQRSVDEELLKWKHDPERKALLVRGARQVGKTYTRHASRVTRHPSPNHTRHPLTINPPGVPYEVTKTLFLALVEAT